MTLPQIVIDFDAPRARLTDPLASHLAADRTSRRRKHTKRAVYAALETHGRPATADTIHTITRQLGYRCTPERVRTVLSEGNGESWVRLDELGISNNGNPAHLWALMEEQT